MSQQARHDATLLNDSYNIVSVQCANHDGGVHAFPPSTVLHLILGVNSAVPHTPNFKCDAELAGNFENFF